MSPETYNHHVTSKKNDFANWIKNSIGDEDLADLLKKTLNKDEFSKKLGKRVAEYLRLSK